MSSQHSQVDNMWGGAGGQAAFKKKKDIWASRGQETFKKDYWACVGGEQELKEKVILHAQLWEVEQL